LDTLLIVVPGVRLCKRSEANDIEIILCNFELWIGAKGEDSSKMLRIFFVRCFAAEAFLVLREIALGGDPAGKAEEAPAAPLGKRSHLRKSTAVSI
jgi:hypothetical protein